MKKKRKICLLLSPLLFVGLLASCQVAGGTEINGDGEWYGLGFQVDQTCRKDYLIGETPSVNDFGGLGYDGGDEVKVKSSELTVEPARPLTEEDKTLTFTWKGNKTGKEYKTTWNINVGKKLISQCEKMDKAPVKYVEPEHTLNHKGGEVDPNSDDNEVNTIDTYAATPNGIQNVNFSDEEECLDSVSDGSRFEFNYTASEKGFIHIYASVASNSIMWSGEYPLDYGNDKNGPISGSQALDLQSIVTIKNNENVVDAKKYASIAETALTKDIMKPYVESKSFNNWYSPLYAATHNFERRWLGVVPLEVGENAITLNLHGTDMTCPWAYKQIACGNWDYIELDYVGENEAYHPTSLQVLKSKNNYIYGDKYDKSALEVLASDENGVMEEVNPNDIALNETLGLSQTSVTLNYKGASVDVPVEVSTSLHSEVGEDNSAVTLDKVENSQAKKKVAFAGSKKSYVSGLSKGDSFNFTYNNGNNLRGKLALYADVASDHFVWQSLTDLKPEIAGGGARFSNDINLKDRIKVTNNGTETALSDIIVKGKAITKDTDMASADANYIKDPWFASYYWTCEQFEKVKIAEVDLTEGTNNIEISFPHDWVSEGISGNGNWASIDFYLLDETITRTPKAIVTTSKANSFLFGEKFSLDGYSFSVEYNDGYLEGIDNSDVTIVDADTTLDIGQTEVKLRYKETEFSAPIIVTDTLTTNLGQEVDGTSNIYNYGKVKYVKGENETTDNHAQKANGRLDVGSYLEKVTIGSYFEMEIDSPSDNVSVEIRGEIATNAFKMNESFTESNAPFEGYYGGGCIVGSNDLELAKSLDLTNTVGGVTTDSTVNPNAIASGHDVTSNDEDLANKRFGRLDESGNVKANDKWDSWGLGTYVATEQFEEIVIGTVTLKKGKNTIRLTFKDGGQAHGAYSVGGVACGNWKSITMKISK